MRMTTRDDLRRLAYIAATAGFFLLIAGVTLVRGQDATASYRFNLYAADCGAGAGAMRFKLAIKDVYSLPICYALGAISIEELNNKYPDKDFMGGCRNGELLTLREIADRALALLPKDQTQGESR